MQINDLRDVQRARIYDTKLNWVLTAIPPKLPPSCEKEVQHISAGALVSCHRMQSSASARKFRNQNFDLPSEFNMGDSDTHEKAALASATSKYSMEINDLRDVR